MIPLCHGIAVGDAIASPLCLPVSDEGCRHYVEFESLRTPNRRCESVSMAVENQFKC